MILNVPNLYIIESFSSKNLSGIPDHTHSVATLFAILKTGLFQRLGGDFWPGSRRFRYEHFCPFAVKVLTPDLVFAYN
jgi:hypothetical protein